MKTLTTIFLTLAILTIATFVSAEEIDFDKLVPCIIQVESSGRPHVVSKAGAIGLMQITPIVFEEYTLNETYRVSHWKFDEKGNGIGVVDKIGKEYNIGDLYNPSINVEIGTWYLKRLYHYYKADTVEKLLMSYNGGITRAKRNNWDLKRMPKETQSYVVKVLKLYNKR